MNQDNENRRNNGNDNAYTYVSRITMSYVFDENLNGMGYSVSFTEENGETGYVPIGNNIDKHFLARSIISAQIALLSPKERKVSITVTTEGHLIAVNIWS